MCLHGGGVATLGATATADSIMTGALPYYGCPSGIIDGVLNYSPYANACCMPHNIDKVGGYFQIQFLNPTLVETVLIINRE